MDYIKTIVPLAQFKSDLSYWIESLADDKQPVLVTRRGTGAFVMQDVEAYAEILELARQAQLQIVLEKSYAQHGNKEHPEYREDYY